MGCAALAASILKGRINLELSSMSIDAGNDYRCLDIMKIVILIIKMVIFSASTFLTVLKVLLQGKRWCITTG